MFAFKRKKWLPSFFVMLRIYYQFTSVPCRAVLCVGAFSVVEEQWCIFGCPFMAKHLTMLGLFGVALSKRRTEKKSLVAHKQLAFERSQLQVHCWVFLFWFMQIRLLAVQKPFELSVQRCSKLRNYCWRYRSPTAGWSPNSTSRGGSTHPLASHDALLLSLIYTASMHASPYDFRRRACTYFL